ncbi:MAG: peptidyl-prolyl cis-trans isomerase [Candidatus Krumholzibacteria bacterium]|nr:peptidyl-prolyl cis-trans isomerase [Candidatus Krumholzibacteria bacterium]
MIRSIVCVFVLLLSLAVVIGCGGEKQEVVENEEFLAARVEDWTLTKEFLYEFISNLPERQKAEFDTPAGRARLAYEFVDEELYYREAKRLKLSEEPSVNEQIETALRGILVQAYYKEYVDSKARPSADEMRDYYDSHKDVYSTLPVVRAQHIFSKSKEKLEDLKIRIEEHGEKMTTLAHQYSEDKITQSDGGDIGYFNPGGYMRGIGYSETLNDTIFTMEPRMLYGPIQWEKGYSLVRVSDMRPAELRPFEDVRQEISEILTREKIKRVKKEVSESIRKNYDLRNYMDEYYKTIQRSPKELFEYAQTTSDPYVRIETFEEIVEKFPDDPHAPQALFMIGFVYIEELLDKVSGGRSLETLIRAYPDSDVADSARWMLDNMNKPLPEFEDIEDLNKKLSGESD